MLQGLVDTKKEYIAHLQNLLAVPIAQKLYAIYIDCKKKGLKHFQSELNKIPKWNNYIIQQETSEIVKRSKCNYLAKLIKLTILTSTKIKFYEYKDKLKHLDIKIPTVEDFIHKCYINASEFAWKNSYLFIDTNMKSVEIQNNLNLIEHNIRKMIAKTITESINIQDIIDYLDEVMENAAKKKNAKKQTPISSTDISSESDDEVNEESESDDEVNEVADEDKKEDKEDNEDSEHNEDNEDSEHNEDNEDEGSEDDKTYEDQVVTSSVDIDVIDDDFEDNLNNRDDSANDTETSDSDESTLSKNIDYDIEETNIKVVNILENVKAMPTKKKRPVFF
jgi:hypothetical protein